jgi:hypothetical protein
LSRRLSAFAVNPQIAAGCEAFNENQIAAAPIQILAKKAIQIHPLGSTWPPHSIQNNMLIMLAESRSLRRKLVRHPADAG